MPGRRISADADPYAGNTSCGSRQTAGSITSLLRIISGISGRWEHRHKPQLREVSRTRANAVLIKINRINETFAVWFTKAFGTMWMFYAFTVYGLLPAFVFFRPHEASFLYWSNWVELWSLPLIMVGTNILGRDAEKRSCLDHEKLAQSYEGQQRTYERVIAMLQQQEDMMMELLKQDRVLEAQDQVLAAQTEMLKEEMLYFENGKTHSAAVIP